MVTTLGVAAALVTISLSPATATVTNPSSDSSATLADATTAPYVPAFGTDVGVYAIAEVTRSLAWDATHTVTIPYVEGPDGTLHMRCSVVEGDDYSTAYCSDGTRWDS